MILNFYLKFFFSGENGKSFYKPLLRDKSIITDHFLGKKMIFIKSHNHSLVKHIGPVIYTRSNPNRDFAQAVSLRYSL